MLCAEGACIGLWADSTNADQTIGLMNVDYPFAALYGPKLPSSDM